MLALQEEKRTTFEKLEHRQYLKFLDRLESHDFYNRSKLFFSELRRTQPQLPNFVVSDSGGNFSTSDPEFLKIWKDFYADLYKAPASDH